MSDSLQPHGLQPARLVCPWHSRGKNTGLGCHSVLQGIFLTQRFNMGLMHCRQILCHLSHQTVGFVISSSNSFKCKVRLFEVLNAAGDILVSLFPSQNCICCVPQIVARIFIYLGFFFFLKFCLDFFSGPLRVQQHIQCVQSPCVCVLFFYFFIFISWRLITLQHCSGFCHTLK